jgi:hypothetical protein
MANIAASLKPLSELLGSFQPHRADPKQVAGLGWRHAGRPAVLPSGVAAIDEAFGEEPGGWPRGRISEIVGPDSSGRTTLLHGLLSQASSAGEICAVVDVMDGFDPATADLNGVDLARLTWVRCGGNLEHAMRAADLLLHSGGLGVVVIDFCGAAARDLARVPASYWFRFRRAVEASQTICVALADRPVAKSCSTLLVRMVPGQARFEASLFRELHCRVSLQKPYQPAVSSLPASEWESHTGASPDWEAVASAG